MQGSWYSANFEKSLIFKSFNEFRFAYIISAETFQSKEST
jgi:hypothetical protein